MAIQMWHWGESRRLSPIRNPTWLAVSPTWNPTESPPQPTTIVAGSTVAYNITRYHYDIYIYNNIYICINVIYIIIIIIIITIIITIIIIINNNKTIIITIITIMYIYIYNYVYIYTTGSSHWFIQL